MPEFAVSARGLEMEESEYIAPNGDKHITKGFPGRIALVQADDEAAARAAGEKKFGPGWVVETAFPHLAPDANDPNAPDPDDVLPDSYEVAPFLPGVTPNA